MQYENAKKKEKEDYQRPSGRGQKQVVETYEEIMDE